MPDPVRVRDWNAASLTIAFGIATVLAAIVLIAPSIVILITSFTDSASLKFPPSGYSLRWYRALADAEMTEFNASDGVPPGELVLKLIGGEAFIGSLSGFHHFVNGRFEPSSRLPFDVRTTYGRLLAVIVPSSGTLT